MPIDTALAVAAGSVVSGLIGANAAQGAADTQAAASQYSADLQKQMFDTQNQQQTGYRAAGGNALANIGALSTGPYQQYDAAGNPIGDVQTGSGYLQHQFNAQDFANNIDPGYAFRLKMGQDQAMRQANLGGGALSGNALAGLQDYTQGSASQEYGNAFNRYQTQRSNIYNTLASIAGLGQTSLGQTATASTQAGANIGNAISNAGAAQAAGTVGSANALSGGIQSVANQYYLSNLLKPQTQTQSFTDNAGWSNGGTGVVNVPGQGTTTIANYFNPTGE